MSQVINVIELVAVPDSTGVSHKRTRAGAFDDTAASTSTSTSVVVAKKKVGRLPGVYGYEVIVKRSIEGQPGSREKPLTI